MARKFSSRRLREARISAGVNPAQLAIAIDRSVFTINQYERGHVNPPALILGRIADRLGCNVDDFYVREAVATSAS
jgi:DNA-binding XRE family transcriptional regulator